MDAFSYTDIFDTKGMEYLVVIAFLLVIIPVWFLLSKPVKEKVMLERFASGLSSRFLKIMPGLLYSRNHTWAHLHETGEARIGVSDLLLHLTGGVSIEYLKKDGDHIHAGDEIAALSKDGKMLKIVSPVSGDILQVNRKIEHAHGIINTDPYGKGWMLKVRPGEWKKETSGFYLDQEAVAWSENELERCKDFLAEAVSGESGQPVLLSGGELVDFPLSGMPEDIWKQFQKKFLE
jgi:glycine cleavage system H protein